MALIRILAAALLGSMVTLSFAAAAQAQTGDVSVSQAWSRATPGGSRTGAAYLQIQAPAGGGDKLVAAKSEIAGRIELHNHIHENGVKKMRRVDAIEVPAGELVALKPGGLHLMLFDLKQPLKAGEKLPLTLVFEKAGEVNVTATVEPIGAKGASGHDSGAHKH